MPKYFLQPNTQFTIGFRFKQLYPNTPFWQKVGLAGKPHLGIDLLMDSGTKLIASLAGRGKYMTSLGAGNQLIFFPQGRNHQIRFLHLKEPPATGDIVAGQEVGLTDNTGTQTTTPHLHVDIYDLNKGAFNINKIENFIDPETYDWEIPMFPAVIKVKVVVNGGMWPSLDAKLAEIKQWYETNSQNKITFEFAKAESHFSNIPFFTDPTTWSAVIDEKWFDAYVLDRNYHITILAIREEDLPDDFIDPNTGQKMKLLARTFGYWGTVPIKVVIGASENDMSLVNPWINAFIDYTQHELMHCCYMLSYERNDPYAQDYTHKYYYPPISNPVAGFTQLIYEHIAQVINLPLMPDITPMIIKEQGKPALYVVESGVAIPIGTDFPTFQSAFPNAKIIEVSVSEFSKFQKPPIKIIKQ